MKDSGKVKSLTSSLVTIWSSSVADWVLITL
jgi:hypothetical protein